MDQRVEHWASVNHATAEKVSVVSLDDGYAIRPCVYQRTSQP